MIVCVLCSHESERKPFLKVDGEWNGVMNSKQPSTGNEECFVDVLALPTIRKKIKKLSAQDPGESKKRWLKVQRRWLGETRVRLLTPSTR